MSVSEKLLAILAGRLLAPLSSAARNELTQAVTGEYKTWLHENQVKEQLNVDSARRFSQEIARDPPSQLLADRSHQEILAALLQHGNWETGSKALVVFETLLDAVLVEHGEQRVFHFADQVRHWLTWGQKIHAARSLGGRVKKASPELEFLVDQELSLSPRVSTEKLWRKFARYGSDNPLSSLVAEFYVDGDTLYVSADKTYEIKRSSFGRYVTQGRKKLRNK